LKGTDPVLSRLNLLLLMLVSFLPFPTRLLAENLNSDDAERVAVTIYGLCLLLCSLVLYAVWQYALHHDLVRDDADDDDIDLLTERLTPSLFGYLAFLGLGLWKPVISVFGFLAVALFLIIPYRPARGGRPRRPAR